MLGNVVRGENKGIGFLSLLHMHTLRDTRLTLERKTHRVFVDWTQPAEAGDLNNKNDSPNVMTPKNPSSFLLLKQTTPITPDTHQKQTAEHALQTSNLND